MIEQRTIGSLTEIYIGGGGNFLTESRPTYFHTFSTRRILAPEETPDDYREVTARERTQIEVADSAWERPPRAFIDLWNSAADKYGTYNESTGYFELNGLQDISYKEAQIIYHLSEKRQMPDLTRFYKGLNDYTQRMYRRTLLPVRVPFNDALLKYTFENCSYLEAVSFISASQSVVGVPYEGLLSTFGGCKSLKRVLTPIYAYYSGQGTNAFKGCEALEEIELGMQKSNISFADSPKLSLHSLEYLVEKSGSGITVTLHPQVFEKLTAGDADWKKVAADAAQKQITFVTN